MDREPDEAAMKDAARRACEAVGLPASYRALVMQRMRTPPDQGPECCGEGCFPCTQTLSDAAAHAWELLGHRPPGTAGN